jgi:hypothetical protein
MLKIYFSCTAKNYIRKLAVSKEMEDDSRVERWRREPNSSLQIDEGLAWKKKKRFLKFCLGKI